jgi:UDP-N-acetyl-D-glucosamine dehydrogenase
MKVGVLGLGYVGFPLLAAIVKSKKYETVGYDPDNNKIEIIRKGKSPVEDEFAIEVLKNHEFNVSNDDKILEGCDIFILCVPTPVFHDYTPDYSFVSGAGEVAAKHLKKGNHVILESTVNPGCSEEILLPVLEEVSKLKAGKDFNIAHCPERINPGDPKWNVTNIPRNVGSLSKEKNHEVANFYRNIIEAEVNEVSTLKVAESTKIIENTFRDINIAYVNELAKLFDRLDIDLNETIRGASNKPFAFMPHWPGRGVGGHCIAVDPYYLIKKATENGLDTRFIKTARLINNSMPSYTVERLADGLNEVERSIKNTPIALLGLSYKENISDLRESPCFEIAEEIHKREGKLKTFEPFQADAGTVSTLKEALEGTLALVIGTAHKQFKELDPKDLYKKGIRVVVDGQNKLDKEAYIKAGIVYRGIGR